MTYEEKKQLWEILPFVTWSKIYFPTAKNIHSDCHLGALLTYSPILRIIAVIQN